MWKKKLRALFLTAAFLLTFGVNAFALSKADAYSYSYWSGVSGYTTGTVNDIMYKYFGSLGYSGTLNDRYHQYLVAQTGLSDSLTLNDLIYQYFVALGTTPGALTYLGEAVTYGGVAVTYNP